MLQGHDQTLQTKFNLVVHLFRCSEAFPKRAVQCQRIIPQGTEIINKPRVRNKTTVARANCIFITIKLPQYLTKI